MKKEYNPETLMLSIFLNEFFHDKYVILKSENGGFIMILYVYMYTYMYAYIHTFACIYVRILIPCNLE